MVAKINLIGLRVGALTVTAEAPRRLGKSQSKTRWIAQCDCGGNVEVDGADLRRTDGKARVSCGCRNHPKGEASPNWLPRNLVTKTRYARQRESAEKRGIEFAVSREYLQSLFESQEERCALTNVELAFPKRGDSRARGSASLDRIDPQLPYIEGNLQWVEWQVNRAKSNMKEADFVEMCRKVAKNAR